MNGFVKEYLKNPYKYVYEADLQIALAKSLDEEFKEKHLINKLESTGIDQPNGFDIGKERLSISANEIIKLEQPTYPIEPVGFKYRGS